MEGLIIENISNLYKIEVDEKIYEANARGKIKQENLSPVVRRYSRNKFIRWTGESGNWKNNTKKNIYKKT